MSPSRVRRSLKAQMADNGHSRELEVLTIDDLQVDFRYQRELNQNLVEKILAEWSFLASEVLTISARKISRQEGYEYYIVNGQHRAAAAKLAGETEILAFVYYGLTIDEEADLRLKTNNRRSDTPQERFYAQLTAGKEESLAIQALCTEFGTKINRTANKWTGINCISAMESLYRVDGGLLLRQTLKFLQDAHGEILNTVATEPVIRGTAWFIRQHSAEYNRADAKSRMARIGADSILLKARAHQQAMGGSMWVNYYRAMVETYNHRRAEHNRLEWRTQHKHVVDKNDSQERRSGSRRSGK